MPEYPHNPNDMSETDLRIRLQRLEENVLPGRDPGPSELSGIDVSNSIVDGDTTTVTENPDGTVSIESSGGGGGAAGEVVASWSGIMELDDNDTTYVELDGIGSDPNLGGDILRVNVMLAEPMPVGQLAIIEGFPGSNNAHINYYIDLWSGQQAWVVFAVNTTLGTTVDVAFQVERIAPAGKGNSYQSYQTVPQD